MTVFAGPIQELVDELGRLPGIGPKSAQRIAFHLLEVPKEEALRLASTIAAVKDRIRLCERCFNVGEGVLCAICSDSRRDASMVCVVEDPRDIVAVGRTREFSGGPSTRSKVSGRISSGFATCSSGSRRKR